MKNRGKKIGRRYTRADCLVEIATDGQYPGTRQEGSNGRVHITPSIQPGSKVYFTIENGNKIIRFIDRG